MGYKCRKRHKMLITAPVVPLPIILITTIRQTAIQVIQVIQVIRITKVSNDNGC